MAELRGAEIARLEILAEALEPVFAQVPEHVDIFDAGILPGEQPRLFIDMIAFVEMGPDKRTYRLIQNTRHGRVVATSTEKQDTMVEAITTYVARRLVERERALAGDRTVEDAARELIGQGASRARAVAGEPAAAFPAQMASARAAAPQAVQPVGTSRPRRFWGAVVEGLVFLAELIGFIVLLVALFGALYLAWTLGEACWQSYFNKSL